MIPFNNHNQSGFFFIEIIASLALLAIFGTSLFLTQATITNNTYKTHQALLASNNYQQYLTEFYIQVMQAVQQNKSFETITLQQTHHDPDYTVEIRLKPLAQSSQLFTIFGKDNYRVEIKVVQQHVEYVWHTFLHIAQPQSAKAS